MTVPITWNGPQCESIAETVRPDSDVDTSNWFSTPLWQKLDDNSDADSVFSSTFPTTCPTRTNYDFEVGLANPSGTPGAGSCQGMRVRVRIRRGEDFGPGQCDFAMRLLQGTRHIATNVHTPGTTFTTYTTTLSISQVDSITNHNDLRIEIQAIGCENSGGNGVFGECAWVELEYYAR